MKHAYIKDEPGIEPGLCYQISSDIYRFPSLVWLDPFAFLFCSTLLRADDRFDMYGVCEIPASSWTDVARLAEKAEAGLRQGNKIPDDFLSLSDVIGGFLASSESRRKFIDALQLTSFWLRKTVAIHPTLTFYGV